MALPTRYFGLDFRKANAMLELTLPNLSCQHCVRTITETVHGLDAQARLDFDVPAHRVRIESTAPPERIAAELADVGYPAA